MATSNTSDINIVVTASIEQAQKNINKIMTQIQRGTRSPVNSMKALTEQFAAIDKATKLQTRALEGPKKGFQGWALSIMFAGMAIKGAMQSIWTASSKTFNEVMHSVEGTTTGFDILQGSMTYLGFTIGQALEPVAAWLAPIIDKVSEWVTENEGLVADIVALGITIGTVLGVGGGAILAISGITEAFGKVKLAAKALKAYDWAGLGSTIRTGIGAVAVYWSVQEASDAFDSFKDKKWVDGMLKMASAGLMAAGGIVMMAGGTAAGGALMVLGIAFKLVGEDKFFTTIGNTIGWISAGFNTLIKRIQWSFEQGMITMLADTVKLMINAIPGLSASLTLSGFDVNKTLDDLAAKAGASQTFDWTSVYREELKNVQAFGPQMDAVLKEFKDSLQSPTQVKMGEQWLGTTGVTQLVSEAFGALSAPGLFKSETFQKDIINSIGKVEINITKNQGEDETMFASRVVLLLAEKLGLNYKNYITG